MSTKHICSNTLHAKWWRYYNYIHTGNICWKHFPKCNDPSYIMAMLREQKSSSLNGSRQAATSCPPVPVVVVSSVQCTRIRYSTRQQRNESSLCLCIICISCWCGVRMKGHEEHEKMWLALGQMQTRSHTRWKLHILWLLLLLLLLFDCKCITATSTILASTTHTASRHRRRCYVQFCASEYGPERLRWIWVNGR